MRSLGEHMKTLGDRLQTLGKLSEIPLKLSELEKIENSRRPYKISRKTLGNSFKTHRDPKFKNSRKTF